MSFDARNNSLTKTKCKGIIRQCDDTIRARKNEIDSLENLQKNYQAQRNELANSVAIEKFKYNDILLFTEEDLNVINSMIRETDYSNPNILTTNLDDIVISIDKVKEQAKEYNHSFERELAYMLVHGFYHIIGYDHMQEDEKKEMREKEENILNKLNIVRK